MSTPNESIQSHIREILLRDWDPNNAGRFEAARGEYDSYLPLIEKMILSGAAEDELVDFLSTREREIMCFPGLGKQRLHRIARKLLALRGATDNSHTKT